MSVGVIRAWAENSRRARRLVVRPLLGLMLFSIAVGFSLPARAASLLTGSVSAPSGKLEGALVRATDLKTGNSISVFSQADGRYAFPSDTLKAGAYKIDIRASGYELAAPIQVELANGKTQQVPIKLEHVKDPSTQWTNAEWIAALPAHTEDGVDQRFVMNMCVHCHSIEKVLRTTYGESILIPTIGRMSSYAVSSIPERIVLRPDAVPHAGAPAGTPEMSSDELALLFKGSIVERMAKYIASVNLSGERSAFPYTPKALPLPKGDATKVVIRTWALPREHSMPHDVVVDANGTAWYTDFGAQVLGRLDPATGNIKEYRMPILRPDVPESSLDVRVAPDGAIWVAMMYQAAVARFDPKTETFRTWSIPKKNSPGVTQIPQVVVDHANVDGKIWVDDASNAGVHRIDLQSGAVETFLPVAKLPPTKGTGFTHTPYGIAADSNNNLFFLDWGESQVGRIDARSGEVTFFQTPTAPSRPRRGHMDDKDQYWFAEWQGDAIGMLDTKTGRIKEYKLSPQSTPYDAIADAFGNAWAAGMTTDRVSRVNIRTGKVTEYLLPERNVNTRRVWVQNAKTGPIFWVGNNLGASIIAVQPLQ